jgi:hypothetical protein
MAETIDDELLEQIAKKHFRINTLQTRKRDRLDFHECAVWSIKDALTEAYLAGQKSITAEQEEESGISPR